MASFERERTLREALAKKRRDLEEEKARAAHDSIVRSLSRARMASAENDIAQKDGTRHLQETIKATQMATTAPSSTATATMTARTEAALLSAVVRSDATKDSHSYCPVTSSCCNCNCMLGCTREENCRRFRGDTKLCRSGGFRERGASLSASTTHLPRDARLEVLGSCHPRGALE